MKKLTELEIETLVIECLQALGYGLPLAVRRMVVSFKKSYSAYYALREYRLTRGGRWTTNLKWCFIKAMMDAFALKLA